jgi:L-ascorbate metabolism protein UlaG (beta-lactamase superfamily)
MAGNNSRRRFFKQFFALSAFSGASVLSFKKNIGSQISNLGVTEANAMANPDYAIGRFKKRITIEYYGMSCFVIISSDGKKIITDPFLANGAIYQPQKVKGYKMLHCELRKEPADVVTVSCGHYAHCYVSSVGGTPYIYKITEPTELHGIKFRGIASRHLDMSEPILKAAQNIIICFEVDGIKICHLGALGHKLSDEQAKQIGEVDILMVPVGGAETLPVADASDVCSQLNPRVVLPMNYRSERYDNPSWAYVDEFLKGKKNVLRSDSNVSSSQLEFAIDQKTKRLKVTSPSPALAEDTTIMVPRFVY